VKQPIRLAIVDDYAVVIAGVASFLAEERIDVVETGATMPVITDVDVVLYDTFGQIQGDGLDLEDFVRDSGAKVVIYSWNLQPDLVERALARGGCGRFAAPLPPFSARTLTPR
jgi:two-component system, NarL family, response regulator LiaR